MDRSALTAALEITYTLIYRRFFYVRLNIMGRGQYSLIILATMQIGKQGRNANYLINYVLERITTFMTFFYLMVKEITEVLFSDLFLVFPLFSLFLSL